jgi:shikimate dehydrogenase
MSRVFGLFGYPLSHSFSKNFFTEKFNSEFLNDCRYENFPLENIAAFPELIKSQPDLHGLNVTIPYKESVIPFLDELSDEAKQIGAVNCIKISSGKLKGFNTDYIGFLRSLKKHLQPRHTHALILGTGGASKAVQYALQLMNIQHRFVSRTKTGNVYTYDELNKAVIEEYTIIINTTPLGMTPQTDQCPDIPYQFINSHHLLFDLIYNPAETIFLQKAKAQGAAILNGHEMLQIQADESWNVWGGF